MELRQITEQNPWWEDRERIKEDEKVKEALSKRQKIEFAFKNENTLIIGPRQVGKTTFLKLFIKNLIDNGVDSKRILYFSCETIKDFNDLVEIVRFSDSLMQGKKYIFFDEITFVNEWQRAVKFVLDSPLINDKFIFVTGSSSIALKKETFPGRPIKIRSFLPLSFKEFCNIFGSGNLKKELTVQISGLSVNELNEKAKKLLFYFRESEKLFRLYVMCGGFPRSAYELIEKGKIREETKEIYWKWLIGDIAKIERSERITSSVLLGVLKNYGTRFSLNSIAKEMEIGSHVTIRSYLEVLENLFILRNVFPIDLKKGVESFKRMRKVYFIDPFLFHSFKMQLTETEIKEEEMPKLVEGIVAEHLIRKFGKILYYYQKKEIDFYLEGSGIEVKWQNKVEKRDFPAVHLQNKILVGKDQFEFYENEMIILPTCVFLLLI